MLFFQELECIISSVPSGEMYFILGDFNAHVGSRESADEEWSSVRGSHGFGRTNNSGRELLSFLALHQATVCNTWFSEERHPQANIATSEVQAMELHRLCVDEATG